jgi:hypothetical protein
MTIKQRVHQLIEESDDQILQAVEALLETYQKQKWPESEINRLNKDIELAEREFSKGRYMLNEDGITLSEKWRNSEAF